MDRMIVYPGAIPLDTDLLNIQRFAMLADGAMAEALIGDTMTASGLAAAPTSPASLSITVGRGAIFALATVDGSSFGSLGSDSNGLVKIGYNEGATTETFTAPGTSGQSINYLIEATFQESDTDAVVLPYYNASNPAVPYTGPANAGTSQNTQRIQRVELQVKAGAAATTGSQTTPAVDSGWVPLYVVTVAYGQTAITSGNIVVAPGAPFILTPLPKAAPAAGVLGVKRNLSINVTSTTAITASADFISMVNASSQAVTASSFTGSINTATSGVLGGLDTGTIAASSWYYVWAVSNGVTSGCVLSLSSSTPGATILAAYPYVARIGAVLTASGTSGLIATIQRGNRVRYLVGGANCAGLPSMLTGGMGSTTIPTWVAVSVSGFVPPTASAITLICYPTSLSSSNLAIVAPNNSYGPSASSTNPPPIQSDYGATAPADIMLESGNIYGATQVNVGIMCVGWIDET